MRAPRCSTRPATALLLLVSAAIGGCASSATPRSTRLTVDDLEHVSREFAASLLASDVMRDRGPDSPLWVVSIERVLNLSRDVMSPGEQWFVMNHLRASLPVRQMRQEKNIIFVLPAEGARRAHEYAQQHGLETAPLAERRPTHVMSATFRSAVRQDEKGATELYYCEFEIRRIGDRELVWKDDVAFKRIARGHIWD